MNTTTATHDSPMGRRSAAAASPPSTKGSTLRATLSYLHREGGAARVDEVLGRLGAGHRERVEGAAAGVEVPFALMAELLEAADAVLRECAPEWVEEAGGYAIESSGLELYPGILKKASPLEFLMQPVSLFKLYYHPGNMEVVAHGEGYAVLRLVGFDHRTVLFCRRQTGGLRRALELAGGRSSGVRHVRCSEQGDAFCEWELRWEMMP